MSNSVDPTYVPVQVVNPARDPFVRRMIGKAIHGNTPFNVPYISKILPGFYQGGCENGLILPQEIEHVISLYRWEKYTLHDNVKTFHEVEMYDSNEGPIRDNIIELATLVNDCRAQGPTLVHCQAGLNRSGLVAATALILSGVEQGISPHRAINILRDSRSPAVLCNRTFESWVLDFKP